MKVAKHNKNMTGRQTYMYIYIYEPINLLRLNNKQTYKTCEIYYYVRPRFDV